jgi:transcription antitermination factor NusG
VPNPNRIHPWYAIRVRSNFELMAAAGLRGKGYEPFVPMYRARRRWSDRVKHVELPLFPGYVFCRFDVTQRLPILTAPGVVAIVSIGRDPVSLDESEIAAIHTVIASGLPAVPWPYLAIGNRVLIEDGPLEGVEGVVTTIKKQQRLLVSVTMLQRSVAVEVDRLLVRPIKPQGVNRNQPPETPLPDGEATRF